MVTRAIQPLFERLSRQYPVVTLTGRRQRGKTTLVRSVFSDKSHVSLEDPDTRRNAMPAFGRDGLLTPKEIDDLVHYVVDLSGREADPADRQSAPFGLRPTGYVLFQPEASPLRVFYFLPLPLNLG